VKNVFAARTPQFRLILSVFLFVAALLRFWVSYDPAAPIPRHPESFRLAYSLYEHGRFANPFLAADTGPSAHLAPVFPAFLAGIMFLFGTKSVGFYVLQFASIFVLALQLSLYPVFARALGMGSLTGAIAATAWILAKPATFYGWEAFYASLVIAVACCLFRRNLDLNQPTASSWLLGCVIGLASLLVQTAIPIFAALIFWDVWRRPKIFFRRFLLPLVVLPILIVTPWTIRNYRVFHRLILVRDDLGLELAVSYNDCAQFALQENFNGCFQQSHPNRSAKEAQRVIELGEADYNRLRLKEAIGWIKSHPRQFVRLTTFRFIAWWMPTETGTRQYAQYAGLDRIWERSFIYLMTLLSVPGLLILYRRDFESAVVCLSCLALFPIIYYFVQFQDRYRYPVLWLTFLLGSLPLSALAERLFQAYAGSPMASSTLTTSGEKP
jgi:hypothetical protein